MRRVTNNITRLTDFYGFLYERRLGHDTGIDYLKRRVITEASVHNWGGQEGWHVMRVKGAWERHAVPLYFLFVCLFVYTHEHHRGAIGDSELSGHCDEAPKYDPVLV